MTFWVVVAVVVVGLYGYAYWRMFRDERPRYAPVSHFESASIGQRWERVTAGWNRQRAL